MFGYNRTRGVLRLWLPAIAASGVTTASLDIIVLVEYCDSVSSPSPYFVARSLDIIVLVESGEVLRVRG